MEYFKEDVKNSKLYIGGNAGLKISNKIGNAEKSIKIVSPYFGRDQIEQLIEKHYQNVDVHLISTNDNQDFRNPVQSEIFRKIIIQERISVKKKEKLFNVLKIFVRIYTLLCIIILGVLSYLHLKYIFTFLFQYKYWIGLFVLIIPIMRKLYKLIKVFSYEYKTLFPVVFIKKPSHGYYSKIWGCENTFVHSKIYIIDEEIAYVGSVNFTNSGFKYNLETCLTIEDKETVIKLSNYFDKLYQNYWDKEDINKLGKRIFYEPIN